MYFLLDNYYPCPLEIVRSRLPCVMVLLTSNFHIVLNQENVEDEFGRQLVNKSPFLDMSSMFYSVDEIRG